MQADRGYTPCQQHSVKESFEFNDSDILLCIAPVNRKGEDI
jgi:hypothetical protein